MNDQLDADLAEWHEKHQFDTIISVLSALPEDQLTDAYLGRLASAYNNTDAYQKAITTLDRCSPETKETALWCYRRGYSFYFLEEFEKALALFEKSKALGDEDAEDFINFCKMEMAERGSVDQMTHPEAMGVTAPSDETLDYVKIFTSNKWTTLSFKCDAAAPQQTSLGLMPDKPGESFDGWTWDAVIRQLLAIHEPRLLEDLNTDAEVASFSAVYPTSDTSAERAGLLMRIILYLVEEDGELEAFIQTHGRSTSWN